MVMRCKQRAAADVLSADVLRHCLGDGNSVKCGGSPAYLVKDNKAPSGRVFQDISDLVHLHHERGLPGGQVVRGSHAGEYLVHHAYFRVSRRDEAPYLRHQHDYRRLPHERGFTGHIRAGDYHKAIVSGVEVRVVRGERVVGEHLFYHRVPAVPYLYHVIEGHFRLDVAVFDGDLRVAAQNVHRRNGSRRSLYFLQPRADEVAHLCENCVLQREYLVVRAKNVGLHLFQLLRDVAFAGGEGLLSYVVRRNLVELPLGDLNVIAENPVVADFQCAYPGRGAFALLYLRKDILSAAGYPAQAVYLLVEAVLYHAAVLHGEGRVVHYRVLHQGGNVVQFVNAAVELLNKRAFHPGKALF